MALLAAEPVLIRPADPADGAALMAAAAQIDRETEFLGVPGQVHPWAERPDAELRHLAETGRGVVLLAVARGGAVVGYLSAFAGSFTRNRGTVFIAVVGLRERYRGQGIGTRLFAAVEAWAREKHAWRLELRVSSLNQRGQALYRKCGFVIEGQIRAGVLRHGNWTDDFWMAKLLEPLPGRPAAAEPNDDRSPASPASRPGAAGAAAGSAIPPPVIRPVRCGDGTAFCAWDARMSAAMPFALKLPGEVPPVEAIERDIAAPPADPRLWLAATVPGSRGEDIVGFASGNIEFGFRMQHDAFVNVAVLPEWQGRGLARELHGRIERWARERGARRLSAALQAPNRAGRGFAAALGYDGEVTMRGYARIAGRMVDRVRLGKLLGP